MKEVQKQFLVTLLFSTGIVFGFHLLALNYFKKALFEALLIEAYLATLILAIAIYFSLYHFRKRFKGQLGFLFLIGSLLKFAVFFLFFNTTYKADSIISSQEFFAFFTPYVLTLIIEVYSLSKWMNKIQ